MGGKQTVGDVEAGVAQREFRWTACEISLRTDTQGRTSLTGVPLIERGPRDPDLRSGSAAGGNLSDRFRF